MAIKQCFPCTACCEGWLSAEINGVKMRPGTPCVNCTKQGCKIYEKRPRNPCVLFKCGWLSMPELIAEHMKPSECGAIIIFSDWHGKSIIYATPVGKTIPSDTLEWLMTFAREYPIPLVIKEYLFEGDKYLGVKNVGYGPPSFIRDVKKMIIPEDILTF